MYVHINKEALEAFDHGQEVPATLVRDDGDFSAIVAVKAPDGSAMVVDTTAPKQLPYTAIVAPRKSDAKTYVPSNALFEKAIDKAIKGDMSDIYVVDVNRVYKKQPITVTFYVSLKEGYAHGTKCFEAYEPHLVYRRPTIGEPLEVK